MRIFAREAPSNRLPLPTHLRSSLSNSRPAAEARDEHRFSAAIGAAGEEVRVRPWTDRRVMADQKDSPEARPRHSDKSEFSCGLNPPRTWTLSESALIFLNSHTTLISGSQVRVLVRPPRQSNTYARLFRNAGGTCDT